jgi:bifunctional UDP-N-acetylglucosamine pyrophosphorylase / glucosamine-1-phosphate N-acetyltransferase
VREGRRVEKFVHHPAIDVLGVNSRVELAQAHAELQMRRNRQLMLAGVTIYSPETVLVSQESSISQDAVLHAGVQICGHCTIGAGAVIGAHSVLRDCTVAPGGQVPPLTGRYLA